MPCALSASLLVCADLHSAGPSQGAKGTAGSGLSNAEGSRFAPSGMFGQRKTPAADATSTLMNFLKQEQAIVSNSTPASTPSKQPQLQNPQDLPKATG